MIQKLREEYTQQSDEARDRRQKEEDSVLNGVLQFAKDRYSICKECEAFSNLVKVCGECYCFMPAKVVIKSSECPIGLWGQISEE